jgi:ABC-2 type transport system permease protein
MTTAPTHLAPAPPAADEAVHEAIAAGSPPGRAGGPSTVLTFGWRGMLKIKHVPEQLIDVTLTPVLLVFLFTYMFGGAIAGSTTDYLQFLLPGMLVMSLLFSTVYSGVALNTDVTASVVDRFRSLPIPRSSPLIGAVLGDSVRYLVGAGVIVSVGAFGRRQRGSDSGARDQREHPRLDHGYRGPLHSPAAIRAPAAADAGPRD